MPLPRGLPLPAGQAGDRWSALLVDGDHHVGRLDYCVGGLPLLQFQIGHSLIGDGCSNYGSANVVRTWAVVAPFCTVSIFPFKTLRALIFMLVPSA